MATNYTIILLIFLLISSFVPKQKVICSCINELNYCILEKYKYDRLYYIISISNCNKGSVLDTMIRYNYIHYQYYAKDDLKLVISKDTFTPESYTFEDNISGVLPYYKQIVGYNIPKEYRKQEKKLLIKNLNLINEINIKP